MALSPGTRLGPYEILGPLGAGGMGEVYLARDQRLGRDVAVKALPEAFAKEPERVSRFEREAKLLASLSHPNIGAIHGLEEVAGQRYLVLEYIEGESLAQRLNRGPLSINEAIDTCRQIAAGLEAAHESGIVHRDLKPANIMLTEDDGVKVLDFGLAKGDDGSGSMDPNLSASPTMTYAPTGHGVILGTAVYMSPEQARGKRLDRRTDIWSFGCVLYECLTGKQAFEGETVSDLIAKILEREPNWGDLPPQTPPRVRRLIERCLRKNARERLRDIGDARLELSEPETAMPAVQIAPKRARANLIPWLIAGLLGVALIASLALFSRRPKAGPGNIVRFSVDTPGGGALTGFPGTFALAPDGHAMVFVMGDEQAGRLWMRQMDDVSCHPIDGTDHASFPFWSPDARHIGFFADGKLKRVSAAGGAVQTICDATNGRGASWGASGTILFSSEPKGPLFKVDAQGGVASAATRLDSTRNESSHRFPQFLPDGRHFLYGTEPEAQGDLRNTCIGSLDEPHGKPVVLGTLVARYVAPGYLVFPRQQALLAQAFDGTKTRGEPVQLEDLPNVSAPISMAWPLSASEDGRLLLYGATERRPTDLVWFDRNGHRLQSVGNHPGLLITPDISPSGDRLAVCEVVGTTGKAWIFDLQHGSSVTLPSDGSIFNPKWTPDNRGLAWLEQVPANNRILYVSADAGERRTLLEGAATQRYFEPAAWSPDGRSLLISENIPGHQRDLRMLTPGQSETATWVGTPAMEETPAFSNDGRWVAYASDISGRREVYLDAFPTPRGAKRVSSSGAGSIANAAFVAWRKDDRELYYLGPDGRTVLVCDVTLGSDPKIGVPKQLLELPPEPWGICAASDGDRFLVLLPVGQRPAPFTVVQNWTRQLQSK